MDDLKRFKIEEQKRKAAEKWEDFKAKCRCTWENHKEEIIFLGPVVVGAATGLARAGARAYSTASENRHRDRETYDPRTGQYYTLKRKMSNSQKLELERRMSNGERKGDILRSMRLI